MPCFPVSLCVQSLWFVCLDPERTGHHHYRLSARRSPATMVRIRRCSNSSRSAGSSTCAVTKTLLVLTAVASGLGVASAFGLGASSSPLIGRALAAAATTSSAAGSGGEGERRTVTAMTAKPSNVFVAGATGRLGKRVVRCGVSRD